MRENAGERERKGSDKGEADVDRKEPEHTARYGYYDRKGDKNGICTGRIRRLGTCSPLLRSSFGRCLPFAYSFSIYPLLLG
ncbi:MAG: hypothetical protein ACN6ON_10855 [Sphingobacterium sp.]